VDQHRCGGSHRASAAGCRCHAVGAGSAAGRSGRCLHRTDRRSRCQPSQRAEGSRLMNTMSNAMTASLVDMPLSRQFGAYLAETRCEIRRYLRMPSFLLPVLLFPAVFYLMFGVLMSSSSDGGVARYLLGSYTTFGVMSPGL